MLEIIVFFFFAAVAVGFALMVVTHQNTVVSAISLVASFFALAVMYVLLEAPFLAALQVIIYAGAIMVLFLFVIMLLNLQRMEEEQTHPVQRVVAWAAVAGFAVTLVILILRGSVFASLPASRFMSDARTIGFTLFRAYLLPFEMVSILLLAAIVGALVLSSKLRPAAKGTEER